MSQPSYRQALIDIANLLDIPWQRYSWESTITTIKQEIRRLTDMDAAQAQPSKKELKQAFERAEASFISLMQELTVAEEDLRSTPEYARVMDLDRILNVARTNFLDARFRYLDAKDKA